MNLLKPCEWCSSYLESPEDLNLSNLTNSKLC
ncbi:hypothetical protein VPHF99_0281 [Vibrio phage F99]